MQKSHDNILRTNIHTNILLGTWGNATMYDDNKAYAHNRIYDNNGALAWSTINYHRRYKACKIATW